MKETWQRSLKRNPVRGSQSLSLLSLLLFLLPLLWRVALVVREEASCPRWRLRCWGGKRRRRKEPQSVRRQLHRVRGAAVADRRVLSFCRRLRVKAKSQELSERKKKKKLFPVKTSSTTNTPRGSREMSRRQTRRGRLRLGAKIFPSGAISLGEERQQTEEEQKKTFPQC